MNTKLHRLVFNAARGLRVVVQETARAAGKGSGATFAGLAAAMLAALPVSAQIVGAPGVPPSLRPIVLQAPNGVPVVNIQTPSAAGVSRNLYGQFDVQARGVVLNNSRADVQSAIGGWINGNPYLGTGPVRIIVNEVSSSSPSSINGRVEIAGQRAEFILANPSGISVNGGTFINAAGVTLTTGAPQYNAAGGLDSYVVRSGTVHIDGLGLDAGKADYAAILARAVQINAALHAKDLQVVTGANAISSDRTRITPTTGTGDKPAFALDTAALGGMYANHIFLVGTEHGLGVRNGGNFLTPGEIVIAADGRLENKGTIEAQRLQIAAGGDIDNRGGTMRQSGGAGLTVTANRLSNVGGVIGAEPLSVAAGSEGPIGSASDLGHGLGAKAADTLDSETTSLARTTLDGATVRITAAGFDGTGGDLYIAGAAVHTPGTLSLEAGTPGSAPGTASSNWPGSRAWAGWSRSTAIRSSAAKSIGSESRKCTELELQAARPHARSALAVLRSTTCTFPC